MTNEVECNKLFDNKVQVMVNGEEVFILPAKLNCDMADLKEAFEAVIAEITQVGTW